MKSSVLKKANRVSRFLPGFALMLPGLPSWDFYQVSGWTLGRLPSFTEFFAVIRSDYLVLLGCQLNSKALTYFYRVLHWNLELLPSFTGFPAELYGAYLVLPSFPLISGAIKDTLGFSCSFSWIFSRLELAWTWLKKKVECPFCEFFLWKSSKTALDLLGGSTLFGLNRVLTSVTVFFYSRVLKWSMRRRPEKEFKREQ